MGLKSSILILTASICFATGTASAAAKRVGRQAAAEYFQNNSATSASNGASGGDNFMMIDYGAFTKSEAYQWPLTGPKKSVAKATYGITYFLSEWNSLDLNLRADFNEFLINQERLVKISFLPLITFPRIETRFPIYFGMGAGLGVFFKQIDSESNLSFDYQLVTGVRMMDLLNGMGFFVEYGLKNHLHLLSDGQLNATAVTGGAVFSF